MTRRGIVALLAGLNAILLTTLVLTSWRLPVANAQAAPMASNYLMVAGEINNDHDALYVLDLAARMMFVMEVDRTGKNLIPLDVRDLKKDFRQGG